MDGGPLNQSGGHHNLFGKRASVAQVSLRCLNGVSGHLVERDLQESEMGKKSAEDAATTGDADELEITAWSPSECHGGLVDGEYHVGGIAEKERAFRFWQERAKLSCASPLVGEIQHQGVWPIGRWRKPQLPCTLEKIVNSADTQAMGTSHHGSR